MFLSYCPHPKPLSKKERGAGKVIELIDFQRYTTNLLTRLNSSTKRDKTSSRGTLTNWLIKTKPQATIKHSTVDGCIHHAAVKIVTKGRLM